MSVSVFEAAIEDKVQTAQAACAEGRTKQLTWRRAQLEALVRMMTESAGQLERAMGNDLGKAGIDAYLTDIGTVITEARLALKNLRRWTRDRRAGVDLALAPGRAFIRREPLGTVLIIGPWNYPVHLLLVPLVGALAAGNAVVLKPSELAPTVSRVLADLIPAYLDPEAVQVIEGGVEETTRVLEQQFDHVFYTGNGTVGSIVMTAAAKHLTPVTLELGGKSPVWVDETFPLEKAARTIAWGKFANSGQTCVAPDYVITTPELAPRLAAAVADAVRDYYGEDPKASTDYSRIVNQRHTERLAALLDSGTAVIGGVVDVTDRYVAPTVLVDVALDSPVMRDEIFGPILPIVAVGGHREAIDVIRSRPKPLALYVFSNDHAVREEFLDRTSSGGLVFGSVMIHLGLATLPFGGVGPSGMGNYHGEHSVRTFSHERAVLHKFGPDLTAMARPPYTAKKIKLLRRG